jgi:hypothetical protein
MQFPRTTRQLRRFIGFVGFGWHFYKNHAKIMAHLTVCLKQGAKLVQTPETLQAFNQVKRLMCDPHFDNIQFTA